MFSHFRVFEPNKNVSQSKNNFCLTNKIHIERCKMQPILVVIAPPIATAFVSRPNHHQLVTTRVSLSRRSVNHHPLPTQDKTPFRDEPAAK
jgi:hypothetical protein